MKLSQLGEFGLIDRIRRKVVVRRGVRIGIGDDAAWVDHPNGSSLITADLLIEGIHFDLRWTSLIDLGHKALAVNLSDIAAMGGTPAYAILSLGIPPDFDSAQIDQLYQGINSLAKIAGVSIVGGDTNTANCLLISVCVIGHPPNRPVRRSGARVGDDIYVTGTLGDAALGLELLRNNRRTQKGAIGQLLKRHHRPTPRLLAGALLAQRNIVTAMIDVSDGLIQDLGHICHASGVGATIEQAQLPLSKNFRALADGKNMQLALSGGEDYELLFCAAPKQRRRIAMLAHRAKVPIARIGTCMGSANGIRVIDSSGAEIAITLRGHDHFKKAVASGFKNR
jgi:thiamine-monophosphate kinase